MSKLQLFFYVFFFASSFAVLLIAFFYWRKFHKIEKEENKPGIQPKREESQQSGKIILGKSKDFDWEIYEDSERLEIKKYLGFDYFFNEETFLKRKKQLFSDFEKKATLNLTTVEFVLLLRFSDYQAEINSDGVTKFYKNNFFDFLNNFNFDVELEKELSEIEKLLIDGKKIQIDAKEVFYFLENENLFDNEDGKSIYKNEIRESKIIESKKILLLENKVFSEEEKLKEKEGELKRKKKNTYFEDNIKILEKTDEFVIFACPNGLQVKRFDAWTFNVHFDPEWEQERKDKFYEEQKNKNKKVEEKNSEEIEKREETQTIHEIYDEELGVKIDDNFFESKNPKEESHVEQKDETSQKELKEEEIGSQDIDKSEKFDFKIVKPKMKKIMLRNRQNRNQNFIGFYRDSMSIEAFDLLLENETIDNKKKMTKILFNNQVAKMKIDDISISSVFKIDGEFYISLTYIVYFCSLLFENSEKFVVQNKLMLGKILDLNPSTKLAKILSKNLNLNTAEDYSFFAISVSDLKFRTSFLKLDKNFVKENSPSIIQSITNASEISKSETKLRIDFEIFQN